MNFSSYQTHATYGEGTLILVDKVGEDRFSVFCLVSDIAATRLLRVWSRRNLIAWVFRILKHLFGYRRLPGPQ